MFDLSGKRVVVTGGLSGIGDAISRLFAENGAAVFILDRGPGTGAPTDGADPKQPVRAYSCDVTSQSSVRSAMDDIISEGGLDILVNNAGISHIGNLETTTEDDLQRVLDVNVKGYFNCMQAVIGHMKERRRGVILNMASISATVGLANRFAYSLTKGAVVSMTYSVARDYLAFNIRSPARVHTPFVDDYLRKNYPGKEAEMFESLAHSQPIGRMGEPKEIAALALYLCSDEAGFITGADYPIDGGSLRLSI